MMNNVYKLYNTYIENGEKNMLEKNIEGASKLLEILNKQEEDLVFDSFTNKDALDLGIILTDVCKDTPSPLSMRVFINDVIVFQYTMEGDYNRRFGWTLRKYNLIKKTGHSSMHGKVRALYLNELQDLYSDKDTYGFGCGGFPIIVKNKGIIGAVAVSGLPDPLDHIYVVKALERKLNVETVKLPLEVDETWFK